MSGPQRVPGPLARRIHQEILPPMLAACEESVAVIGIDGPTAAGKTILADDLAELLRRDGRPVWSYRLDWTLAEREPRLADLAHLREARVDRFPFEGELHMRLELARGFLEQVRLFREALHADSPAPRRSRTIRLDRLYSRPDGGRAVGSAECRLEAGLVILVEGHYTARPELDALIDLNLLLLSSPQELLRRKVARVRGYRGEAEAVDYFHRIDLPSFRHHLARFGTRFDQVVDNSDYRAPRLESLDFVRTWLGDDAPTGESLHEGISGVAARLLSPSRFVDAPLASALEALLEAVVSWDRTVGDYLCRDRGNVGEDLRQQAESLLAGLEQRFARHAIGFKLRHTHALHRVHDRRLPLSLGISVVVPRRAPLHLLAEVGYGALEILLVWEGGRSRLRAEREIGAVTPQDGLRLRVSAPHQPLPANTAVPRLLTPTPFAVPGFLRDLALEIEVVDEAVSPAEGLSRLFSRGGVWVQRFSRFAELALFEELVAAGGGMAVRAGLYLIALRSDDAALQRRFKAFRRRWAPPLATLTARGEDEAAFDRGIDEEEAAARAFVRDQVPELVWLDGALFCPDTRRADGNQLADPLARLLGSPLQRLREQAVAFIERHFPDLRLPVAALWDDLPDAPRDRITLAKLVSLVPTPLAELYLWLALREEPAALLGANIYDIRSASLDCRAYLRAADGYDTPIVLQASLNALGQPEEEEGTLRQGYLQPEEGALDLIRAAANAARDLFLGGGRAPLYGVGLDHVAAAQDRPAGRAARFLERALASGMLTHVVADGSARFDAPAGSPDASPGTLEDAFARQAAFVASLLGSVPWSTRVDLEVCAGKLDYGGAGDVPPVHTAGEMERFVELLHEALRGAGVAAVNTRPTLLAGNLGTVHHGEERGVPEVERSAEWLARLNCRGIAGAVLHGTTATPAEVLDRATVGCRKINVAGALLHTLVAALPPALAARVAGAQPKYRLAELFADLDRLPLAASAQIEAALQAHCEALLGTLRAPRLEVRDRSHFHRPSYRFTPAQLAAIADALRAETAPPSTGSPTPASDELDHAFSASMIEVPFGPDYCRLVDRLVAAGVRHFHIDVGDGRFIPRLIDALDKVGYLRHHHPAVRLHAHLMADEPQIPRDGDASLIDRYLDAGCHAVALHPRAVARPEALVAALQHIRRRGARPGLVLETSQPIDDALWSIVRRAELDWSVVMGVPVGYGGQRFDRTTLERLAALHRRARADGRRFLIEIDGGLTFDLIEPCRRAGAQLFAGWSIVRGDGDEATIERVWQLQRLLAEET